MTPLPDLEWAGPFGVVVFDLDGTLAEPTWPQRHTIGDPIPQGLSALRHYAEQGLVIIVHTSRPLDDLDLIWDWLESWDLPVDRVICNKPLAALYVDDRGWRPWWSPPPLLKGGWTE